LASGCSVMENLQTSFKRSLNVKIAAQNSFFGPSAFAKDPVIVVLIESIDSNILVTAQEALERIPGIFKRLDWAPHIALGATPIADIAAAAANLALHMLNMNRGFLHHASVYCNDANQAVCVVAHHVPQVSFVAVQLALEMLDLVGGPLDSQVVIALDKRLTELLMLCRREHPDYIARIIMQAARERGIPIHRSETQNRTWYYGWGNRSRRFLEAASDDDGLIAGQLAKSKTETTRMLKSLGFPTVYNRMVTTEEQALKAAAQMGGAVVVKPDDRGQGLGVTVGLLKPADIVKAFHAAREVSVRPILIERFVPGDDHRLLVVNGKLVAAAKRSAPNVIGDGSRSVRELVLDLNVGRRDSDITRRYLKPVKIDDAVLTCLALEKLTPESVPAAGRSIQLRTNANISTGGTPVNVLSLVHPDVKAMAEMIGNASGLYAVGIDYLTTDIAQPWDVAGGAVIELNSYPGLDVHVASYESEEKLGDAILGPEPGRIPIVVVVASSVDLDVLTSLAARGRPNLAGIGQSWPSRGWIGRVPLCSMAISLHERTRRFLSNPTCRGLLIGCTSEDIAKHGFPVDRADVVFLQGPVNSSAETAIRRSAAKVYRNESIDIERINLTLARLLDNPGRVIRQSRAELARKVNSSLASHLKILSERAIRPGPSLIALMRNESYLLPHFFAHYRDLGVENFIVYDDGSRDGTREFLANQLDCTLVTSDRSFNELLSDGRSYHHGLRQVLQDVFLPDRWAISVDADEFLILPPPFTRAADFEKLLDKRGHSCVFGTMIDAYPVRLRDRHYSQALSPFEGSPYVDSASGFRRLLGTHKPQKMLEGIRGRLIRRLREEQPKSYHQLFGNKGYLMPALFKVPFLHSGRGLVRLNSHTINAIPPYDVEVALGHFKFGPDFDSRMSTALSDEKYYLGSIEYKILSQFVEYFEDIDLRYDGSIMIEDKDLLSRAGFLKIL
jgi:cyanophycin synthetase